MYLLSYTIACYLLTIFGSAHPVEFHRRTLSGSLKDLEQASARLALSTIVFVTERQNVPLDAKRKCTSGSKACLIQNGGDKTSTQLGICGSNGAFTVTTCDAGQICSPVPVSQQEGTFADPNPVTRCDTKGNIDAAFSKLNVDNSLQEGKAINFSSTVGFIAGASTVLANTANEVYPFLTKTSTCVPGTPACVQGQLAKCGADKKFALTPCDPGKLCTAVPLSIPQGKDIDVPNSNTATFAEGTISVQCVSTADIERIRKDKVEGEDEASAEKFDNQGAIF